MSRSGDDVGPTQTAVAIVGAGPVGLLLACELGLRGVPTIVLTDAVGLSTHPKANTHGARSMEIYRRHGISSRLRAQSPSKASRTDVAYYTRLLDRELHRVDLPTPVQAVEETRAIDTRWPTPEPQLRCSQLVLEPLLFERAQSFPTNSIRFAHKVVDMTPSERGVSLTVENSGGAQQIEADYVVGCDGGRSFVRRAMGSSFAGEGGLRLDFMGGRMSATYFRAKGLHAMRRHPYAWQNWFILPHRRALMVALDIDEDLYLMHVQLPDDSSRAKAFQDIFDDVIGAHLPVEIISSADWRAGIGLVAERFGTGRTFIAGDAAHLFTPTGGFGLNTGIDDAFNLGWKLAAVSNGWASPALLESYETERKPIAIRNTDYALTLARRNGECPVGVVDEDTRDGEAAREAVSRHFAASARWEYDTPGLQLGVRYRGSPVLVDDGSEPPADDPTLYTPDGTPGGRLPHVWLAGGVSLFDRLGPEFTLLDLRATHAEVAGPRSDTWREAASARGVPLVILDLPDEPHLRRLAGADLVLVRPDQHVAWRGQSAGDPGHVLDIATGREAAVAHRPEMGQAVGAR